MNDLQLEGVPIVMAGGVWYMRDWADWIEDPEIAPVAFQLGTRPLLTQESPISDQWKKRLLDLEEGDVFLNKYSPTGLFFCRPKRAYKSLNNGRIGRSSPMNLPVNRKFNWPAWAEGFCCGR